MQNKKKLKAVTFLVLVNTTLLSNIVHADLFTLEKKHELSQPGQLETIKSVGQYKIHHPNKIKTTAISRDGCDPEDTGSCTSFKPKKGVKLGNDRFSISVEKEQITFPDGRRY